MPNIQETAPETLNIGRQLNIVYLLFHFIQVQAADVIRRAMNQGLLQQPSPLKGVIQINFSCAPDKMTGG